MFLLPGINNYNKSDNTNNKKEVPTLIIPYNKLLKIVKSYGYNLIRHTVYDLQPDKLACKIHQYYYPNQELDLIDKPVYWWNRELYTWTKIGPSYSELYDKDINSDIILHITDNKYISSSDIQFLENCIGRKLQNYIVYGQDLVYGKYINSGLYDLSSDIDIIYIIRWIGIIILSIILAYFLYRLREVYK